MSTVSPTSGVSAAGGEYVESIVLVGAAVGLTTGAVADVTTISLTAGDWDVSAVAGFVPAATTSITHISNGISTVSATMGSTGTQSALTFPAIIPGATLEWFMPSPVVRLSLSATTTVYLVVHTEFTVSTLSGYGKLCARRVR